MATTRNESVRRFRALRCPRAGGLLDLSQLPAAAAGNEAYRLFCTPELSQHRADDHHLLTQRARFHLRHARWERIRTAVSDVQCYVFDPEGEPRGTVLLVHGWTSESAFMTAFIEPLRRSGFRVVAFDFPAHGHSPGRRTNLAECARAMLGVADHYGPVHAAVAHSFGGFVGLLVAEGGPPLPHAHKIERFVLLACPNKLGDVTHNFGLGLGLSKAGQRAYERHLERIGHRSVAGFTTQALLNASGAAALIIHGREDTEVPFADAEAIARACPHARLMAFNGLGHRTILYASPVFRAVMNELARPLDHIDTSGLRSKLEQSSSGQEMKASA